MAYADIYHDVVQVAGGPDDSDQLMDEFPTLGRTADEVRAELRRRYGALAPTEINDLREDKP